MLDIELATQAFIDCLIWSSIDEECQPLDYTYSIDDVDPESVTAVYSHIVTIYESYTNIIDQYLELQTNPEYDISELFGHDMVLTQNGHGAGFWDRGLGELGELLTAMASNEGEAYIYVNDKGGVGIDL